MEYTLQVFLTILCFIILLIFVQLCLEFFCSILWQPIVSCWHFLMHRVPVFWSEECPSFDQAYHEGWKVPPVDHPCPMLGPHTQQHAGKLWNKESYVTTFLYVTQPGIPPHHHTLSVWQLVLPLQCPPDVCCYTDGMTFSMSCHLFLWSVAAVAYCVDIVDPDHLQSTAHFQASVWIKLGVIWNF